MRWIGWLALAAGCAGPAASESDETSTEPAFTTAPATDPYACTQRAGKSACDNQASIVQGIARVPDGAPTRGDLVVAMLHGAMGDPEVGGHGHWAWTFPDVDLSRPVPFKVDMCDGNAIMWSEENCGYNLVVLLDSNHNNGLTGVSFVIPDPGEPATLIPFDLSCHDDGPLCLGDVPLDCTDGAACLHTEDPGHCVCDPDGCDSQGAICTPE